MGWWKEFVFIYQFQPRIGVVALGKIHSRFQQVTVLIRLVDFFVLASPDQRCGPIPTFERPVVLERGGLAMLAAGFQCFGMLETTEAILRSPVAGWCHSHPA